jgi:hypothetical protein
METQIEVWGYMQSRKTFISMRTLIISGCALVVMLTLARAAMGGQSEQRLQVESLIGDKIAAYVSERVFWGALPIMGTELKLILFIADKETNPRDFDVLAVVPEINETLKLRSCQAGPAIIVSGSGNSDPGLVEASKYLSGEIGRYSSFISTATKSERIIHVVTDPANLFSADAGFRSKRVEQIKSALGALVHQRPLALKIASFSKFTDQIDALVPSRGKLYTMSVVHTSCSEESVEVGRETTLKSVRPDLRKNIELHSIPVTIN